MYTIVLDISWRKLIFSKQQRASRHRAEGWGYLNFGGKLKHLLHNRSYYYKSKINNKVSFGSENLKFLVYFKGRLLRSILFLAPKLFPTPPLCYKRSYIELQRTCRPADFVAFVLVANCNDFWPWYVPHVSWDEFTILYTLAYR